MDIEDLDEKANAGRKLTWGELAQKLVESEKARQTAEANLAEVRHAAELSIALSQNSIRRMHRYMNPESLAEVWFEAYEQHVAKTTAAPIVSWDRLERSAQREIIAIAKTVRDRFDERAIVEADNLDAVSADILKDGENLGMALERLEVLVTAARHMWSVGIVPAIQALKAAGVEILPPGSIVHGVPIKTHPRPHRPE